MSPASQRVVAIAFMVAGVMGLVFGVAVLVGGQATILVWGVIAAGLALIRIPFAYLLDQMRRSP